MKQLVIIGAQESGVGAARLAQRQGHAVFVSDSGNIQPAYREQLLACGIPFEEGGHSAKRVLAADEIVKSPGVPDSASLMVAARAQGIPVISEIELAYRYCNGRIIGITGSNGKTTTTLLTHHVLASAGVDVALGGNVGNSFAALVAEGDHAWYVLELSSFQLDGIVAFRPDVAMLLNITPDHLDRYEGRMDRYVKSKFRIAMNLRPQDHFIYNLDDHEIARYMREHPVNATLWPFSLQRSLEQGGYMQDETIHIHTPGIGKHQTNFNMSIIELALQGRHNVYNSLAAGLASRVLEIRDEVLRNSLSDFQNIEHRLEHVGMVHDIEFINDSKATNVNSSWYALESMDKPVIWVAGGQDKGNDYSALLELVRVKVKAIVCLGTDNAELHKAFGGVVSRIEDVDSAEQAVRTAFEMADAGDVVLLSPACASFDRFTDYRERGNRFKAAVKSL